MSTQLRFRRGNTTQTNAFTGALAEVTVDTDKKVVVVHDGSTPGGFPAPTLTYVQAAFDVANTANAGGGSVGQFAQASFSHANSAYDQANLSGYYANTAWSTANNKVSKSGDTITGTLVVTDNVSANIIIANHQFYSGLATLQATPLPNLIAQFTGDSDTYVQVNAQNIDPYGSADYVVTADVGNDTEYFIDMGITNSLYALNEFPFHGLDGYLVVQGSEGQLGGNLVIGTSTTGTHVNIIAGGNTDAHIAATFDSDANTTLHGYVLPHQGNMYDLGEEARPWDSLWLADSLNIGSIKLSQNTTTNTLVITGATDILLTGSPSTIEISNTANAAYTHANSAYNTANSAGSFANGAFTKANSANIIAQSAFDAANNVAPQIEPAFAQANSAASFANAAFLHANSAYAVANNALNSTTGGTVSGDVTITGNLVINGTTTTVNTTTISTTDSLIKLANNNTSDSIDIGFYGTYNDGSQKYTGLIKQAGGNYFLFNKLTNDPSGNVLTPGSLTASNTATLTANLTSYSVTINGRDVENYLQNAYDAANTSDSKAVSAGSFANSAFIVANSAASFANGAFGQANSAASFANGAFDQANSAASFSNSAFITANSAASFANGAFGQANSAASFANGAFDRANSAASFANGAFVTANSAAIAANNRVLKSGDTMTGALSISDTTVSNSNTSGALRVSGGVGVTGSIYGDAVFDSGRRVLTVADAAFESGNSGSAAAAVASYYANLAFDKANSAYDSANSAGSFANGAFITANSAASFANGAFGQANSAALFANGAFDQANSAASFANGAFGQANSAASFANGAFDQANSAASFANGAFTKANSANIIAQSAFDAANNVAPQIEPAFGQANSAALFANGAFARANSGYEHANSAYGKANTSVQTSGDNTINGSLTISNVGGTGLTVTGNVFFNNDLTVSGNLTIQGNTTAISANNLVLDDSIIFLANNNTSNTVDIGIVGQFTTDHSEHTGVVRDHVDGTWKFFSNVIPEPTTTIDFTNALYEPIKVGSVIFNTNSAQESKSNTTSSTSQTTVYSFNKSQYRTAKIIAQLTSGTSYHAIELILIHDDTTVYLSQYGEVTTGASLGTFDATISGSDVLLQLTATNSSTTVKVASTLIST